MAATSGRKFVIKKAAAVLAGLRENSMSFDGSPVNVTDKGSSGFREIASFAGVESFEISASGVTKSTTFLNTLMDPANSKLLTDITIEYGDGTVVDGDVYVASLERTGAHDGEETFTITMQSSGTWTVVVPAG